MEIFVLFTDELFLSAATFRAWKLKNKRAFRVGRILGAFVTFLYILLRANPRTRYISILLSFPSRLFAAANFTQHKFAIVISRGIENRFIFIPFKIVFYAS